MNPTPKLSRLSSRRWRRLVFIGLAPAAAVAQTTAPATTDAPAATAPAAPAAAAPRHASRICEAAAACRSRVRGSRRRRA